MVKVREDYSVYPDGTVDLESWLDYVQRATQIGDISKIRAACELAQQLERESEKISLHSWSDTSSCYQIGIEMATILSDLRMDETSIIAAMLYRFVREELLSLKVVEEQFGAVTSHLIDGVLKMAAISSRQHPTRRAVLGQSEAQVANVRKMLVSIIDDVRVALVKLAERTCCIRAVKDAADVKRKRVAREVFDIYAPLAHRLGIGHIKWELEDLAFRYLEPVAYKKIAKLIDERRLDRQEYIASVVSTLKNALDAAGISSELYGRAKHIYSIWRKMRRKNIDFSQVYDIRAIRILVPEVRDCYAALGMVHAFWRHIPHEFDDYIANPKDNGYRSLHTAVVGPDGKVFEVQIRTFDMHEDAELGVCAHWRYKGTDASQQHHDSYEQKIAWLRQVLEWHEDLGDDIDLLSDLQKDVAQDRIYVFTPDGHVVDLPPNSTPVDFAYRVHTEIGHRCRGAKVNGRIVTLNSSIKTGDQIEILTAKEGAPSRDWLNPNLGYIVTPRARGKVMQWFKRLAWDQNIIDGKAILQPEIDRLALQNLDFTQVAKKLNYKAPDDLFAAIGAGDVGPARVINIALQQVKPASHPTTVTTVEKPETASSSLVISGDVTIQGVGNLVTQLASCCKPMPGDSIVGYVTKGRGVTVHRDDCINAVHLESIEPARMIEVAWGAQPRNVYPVDIMVKAFDRTGLLRDITSILADGRVNVLAVNTLSDRSESTADMLLSLEIENLDTLGKILARINQLPNVLDVKRQAQ